MKTSKFVSRLLLCGTVGLTLSAQGASVSWAQDAPPPAQPQTGNAPPESQAQAGNAPQTSVTLPSELMTDGVTFAPVMQLEQGQTRRYGMQSSITMRFAGKNGGLSDFASTTTMGITLRYRVLDARTGGGAQVEALSEGGRMLDAGGQVQSVPKDPDGAARLLTLDRQSRITAFKDAVGGKAGAGSGMDALFNQSNLFIPLQILPLPDKPVHVGESWTANYATSGKSGETGVKATLTLLGSEKIGGVPTVKIKQVLTVPYVAYTDAQGKSVEARGAKGRMNMLLTFTQMVNALPESGLLVRSEGGMAGTIKFEGALLGQVPGDTMTIGGKLLVVRLEDSAAQAAAQK